MKTTFVAATLAAVVASTTLAGFAVAQQPAPAAPQAGAPDRDRDGPRFSEADRLAFTDARIAGLKAGLKLTSEQEKLWPGVETALRDAAKARGERAAKWREERTERRGQTDFVQHTRQRADRMVQGAEELRKFADAIDPLYKTLDDSQKRRFGVLLRQNRQHAAAWRANAWRHAEREANRTVR